MLFLASAYLLKSRRLITGEGKEDVLSDVHLPGLRYEDNGDVRLGAVYGTHMLKGRKVMGYLRNKREKPMRELPDAMMTERL